MHNEQDTYNRQWIKRRLPFVILTLIGASYVPEQWDLDFMLGSVYGMIVAYPLRVKVTPVRYDVGERYPGFPDKPPRK